MLSYTVLAVPRILSRGDKESPFYNPEKIMLILKQISLIGLLLGVMLVVAGTFPPTHPIGDTFGIGLWLACVSVLIFVLTDRQRVKVKITRHPNQDNNGLDMPEPVTILANHNIDLSQVIEFWVGYMKPDEEGEFNQKLKEGFITFRIQTQSVGDNDTETFIYMAKMRQET